VVKTSLVCFLAAKVHRTWQYFEEFSKLESLRKLHGGSEYQTKHGPELTTAAEMPSVAKAHVRLHIRALAWLTPLKCDYFKTQVGLT